MHSFLAEKKNIFLFNPSLRKLKRKLFLIKDSERELMSLVIFFLKVLRTKISWTWAVGFDQYHLN